MGDGEQLRLINAVDGVAADVPDLTPLGAQNHVPGLQKFDEACGGVGRSICSLDGLWFGAV